MVDDVEPRSDGDDEYDENADEDFRPDEPTAADDEDVSSSEEDDHATAAAVRTHPGKRSRKRKIAAVAPGEDKGDELDSGDEATIRERKRKRRKGGSEDDEPDSGGEGGLIKTRAQRVAEQAERKQHRRAQPGDVTIDVDEIWADLSRMPVGRPLPITAPPPVAVDAKPSATAESEQSLGADAPPSPPDLITIKRQIEYAGEVTTISEQVPRTSAAAQAYLRTHAGNSGDGADTSSSAPPDALLLHRPLRRPSLFEPNPTAAVKGVAPGRLRPRAPSRHDVLALERRAAEERRQKAERMTTVQKSALDWRGFVRAHEGLQEELDEYGKSKRGFLAREEFLDRAQGAREERAREARLKG